MITGCGDGRCDRMTLLSAVQGVFFSFPVHIAECGLNTILTTCISKSPEAPYKYSFSIIPVWVILLAVI